MGVRKIKMDGRGQGEKNVWKELTVISGDGYWRLAPDSKDTTPMWHVVFRGEHHAIVVVQRVDHTQVPQQVLKNLGRRSPTLIT